MKTTGKRHGLKTILLGLGMIGTLVGLPLSASAEPNMTASYEVKLLLDPSVVLNSDHKLKSGVRGAFGMPETVIKQNVLFMDTDEQDLYANGWNARIRKIEDEDDFELTYKKRYSIANNDINAALTQANAEGFDASDTNYKAEVEWGYQKKTLSVSTKKTASDSGYGGMDLPSAGDARDMLIDKIPGKLDDWLDNGWGEDVLEDSRKYGPILTKKYEGVWSGLDTDVEIWPILDASGTGTEYIVEISFKTDSYSVASTKHDALIAYLQGQGWFLAQDSLKTQLVMERY